MSATEIVVVDYGMGNMLSVCRALEFCGANVRTSGDPGVVATAAKVVLPGVGAFADGMAELRRTGLDSALRDIAASGKPLLGICLGMQMLLEESDEFGKTRGLALIPGRVVPVPAVTDTGEPQKIPRIGWYSVGLPQGRSSWEGTPLSTTKPGAAFYFVHSFMARPLRPEQNLADSDYGGTAVSVAIGYENVFGCQFHPEKSGEAGLRLLRRFIEQ